MARILIVDDEDGLRFMTRRTLEGKGYEVVEASNGEEGAKAVAEQKPDAVLTDWNMPKGGGSVVVAAANAAGVPVAIVAAVENNLIPRGVRALGKPYDVDDLRTLVKELLEL